MKSDKSSTKNNTQITPVEKKESDSFVIISKKDSQAKKTKPVETKVVNKYDKDDSMFPVTESDVNLRTQDTTSFTQTEVTVESNDTRNIFSQEYEMLRGFSFWTKFQGVYLYITSILMIIIGIPLLLAFGAGLIYIGAGVLGLYFARRFSSAGKLANQMTEVGTRDESFQLSMMILNKLKQVYKVTGIITIIFIVLGLLGSIIAAVSVTSFINSDEYKDLQDSIELTEQSQDDALNSLESLLRDLESVEEGEVK